MVKSLTKIQEHLLRFRYLDNSLIFLSGFCNQSKSPYATSIFFKYATIDLISFLDHYDSVVGLTTDNQKTLVLAMSPFLDEIFENQQEIRETRNKWTAHVLKGGGFQKELSKKLKKYFTFLPPFLICSRNSGSSSEIILLSCFAIAEMYLISRRMRIA